MQLPYSRRIILSPIVQSGTIIQGAEVITYTLTYPRCRGDDLHLSNMLVLEVEYAQTPDMLRIRDECY
jgi:hypothetical protein